MKGELVLTRGDSPWPCPRGSGPWSLMSPLRRRDEVWAWWWEMRVAVRPEVARKPWMGTMRKGTGPGMGMARAWAWAWVRANGHEHGHGGP